MKKISVTRIQENSKIGHFAHIILLFIIFFFFLFHRPTENSELYFKIKTNYAYCACP